jgi:ribosomal protein S18 acetylase RimI-like enzyme
MTRVRRVTTGGDREAAGVLLSEYVEWIRAAAGFDPFVEQPGFATELSSLRAHYGGPDRLLFIACLGDDVAGVASISFDEEGNGELKRMYVRPAARGRGVADALISAVLAAAGARGCRGVWLESVRGAMDPAIAAYRRNGFTIAEHRRATLGLDGAVVMERRNDG